jgi:hypothetical protein
MIHNTCVNTELNQSLPETNPQSHQEQTSTSILDQTTEYIELVSKQVLNNTLYAASGFGLLGLLGGCNAKNNIDTGNFDTGEHSSDTADTADTADTSNIFDTADTADTANIADTADTGDTADTSNIFDTAETGETAEPIDTDNTGDTGDTGCEETSSWYQDNDGDGYGDVTSYLEACYQPTGYVADNTDCDDTDATINPGATETYYDGIDQNCDGLSDNDADGDGYDSADHGGTDCDDFDATIYPGATETYYDGIDQNCDGLSDYDADEDGYESDAYGGTDCDDADATINPGALEYQDGVDNNCDGTVDENLAASEASTSLICVEEYGYCGQEVADLGDISGTGENCVGVGAPVANGYMGWTDSGETHIFCGVTTGEIDTTTAIASIYGEGAYHSSGYSIAGIGDVDADGFDDMLIGAPATSTRNGNAYLVLGPVTGSFDLGYADAVYSAEASSDHAGREVAPAGDMNVDGYMDFLISANENDNGASDAGIVYLVHGQVAVGNISLADADASLEGISANDNAGISLDGNADINGDGIPDILIGADGESTGGTEAGAAFVVYGPVSGSQSLLSANAFLVGENDEDLAGFSVALGGDVNNDGYDDCLIGAYQEDHAATNAGAIYLINGPVTGTVSLSAYDAVLYGESAQDYAGYDIDFTNIDGDSHDDILAGAYQVNDTNSNVGAGYVVLGPISGALDLVDADVKLVGESTNDFLSYSVSNARDVDGDGIEDVVLGMPRYDTSSLDNVGSAHIFLGSGY